MRTKAKKLETLLNSIEGQILIVDHKYSDADGIASKYAWSNILTKKFNLESTIGKSKELTESVSQYLTKKFESVSKIINKEVEDVNLKDYAAIIMVDTSPYQNNNPFSEKELKSIDPKKIIVIDHHGKNNKQKTKKMYGFEDIEDSSDIVSTSTQTMEYMKDYNLKLDKEEPFDQLLATALWTGFDIDAKSQKKTPTSRDLKALSYIIDTANKKLKEEIENKKIPETAMRAIGRGLENFAFSGPYAISNIGEINVEQKNCIIAPLADQLLSIEGISASIAWALVSGHPYGSVRTKEDSPYNAREIAKMFGGNGHLTSAGFKSDLGFYSDYPETLTKNVIKLVESKILSTIASKTGKENGKKNKPINLERKIIQEQLKKSNNLNLNQIPEPVILAKGKILSKHEKSGTIANGYVGELVLEHIPYLVHISEELLKMEGINTSIVWALINGTPIGYIKSDENSLYEVKDLSKIFDKDQNSGPEFIINTGLFKDYPDQTKNEFISLTNDMILYKIKKRTGEKNDSSK